MQLEIASLHVRGTSTERSRELLTESIGPESGRVGRQQGERWISVGGCGTSLEEVAQRIGAAARPDSSALRLAQATVGREPSTCVTDAPAAAALRVAAPVYPNRFRTEVGGVSPATAPRTQSQFGACS